MLKKDFKHASRFWESDGKFRLMIRKGVYPYEYMDSWKRFEEIVYHRKAHFTAGLT